MIDKLKVYTDDFQIDKLKATNLILRPASYSIGAGEQEQEKHCLFNDNSGKLYFGLSAYLNTELYNLDITTKGLFVQFNPSKIYHDINFYPVSSNQVKIVCNEIAGDLKDNGIQLNFDNMKVSRLDLAKNINVDYGFTEYSDLLRCLSGKRMNARDYGTSYLFYNKSREISFYDKIEEMKTHNVDFSKYDIPLGNVMRAELRFKQNSVVKRDVGLEKVNNLYDVEYYDYLKNKYKKIISDVVFKNNNLDEQLRFDFVCEMDRLKSFVGNGGIPRYRKMLGLNELIKVWSPLDKFKKAVRECGYTRQHANRVIKEIQDDIKDYKKHNKKYEDHTIGLLYDELHTKLVA